VFEAGGLGGQRETGHRLWKQERLKVPAKTRKRRRLGESANGTQRLRAERINQVATFSRRQQFRGWMQPIIKES
jgi:hypothetical protein